MAEEIPEPIKRFLFEQIRSFEELEVVMLLSREPAMRWTQQGIAERLKINVNLIDDALKALGNRGIVDLRKTKGTTHYAVAASCKDVSDRLVSLYEDHRLEIVMLMSSNAIERMRTGAMRTFADSFFIGRKRSDG